METWTIKRLMEWISGYFEQKGVDSPRLSAELLLCHVLGLINRDSSIRDCP